MAEVEVIREYKYTSSRGIRIVRKGGELFIQYEGLLKEIYEANLRELIKLIDTYCADSDCGDSWWWKGWWKERHNIDYIFARVVRVAKRLPVGELPGWHITHMEQIYGVCYRGKFYRLYAAWGGIWGDYRPWLIVAPPINNEVGAKWCSYCRSEFC